MSETEMTQNEMSEVTRRSIIDHFSVSHVSWAGRYTDDDFLGRLYDLTRLPYKCVGQPDSQTRASDECLETGGLFTVGARLSAEPSEDVE